MYVYGRGSPINFVDPSGTFDVPAVLKEAAEPYIQAGKALISEASKRAAAKEEFSAFAEAAGKSFRLDPVREGSSQVQLGRADEVGQAARVAGAGAAKDWIEFDVEERDLEGRRLWRETDSGPVRKEYVDLPVGTSDVEVALATGGVGELLAPLGRLLGLSAKAGAGGGAAEARVLGARGPATSWEGFSEELAGGPVRQLSTSKLRVTGKGVTVAEKHTLRFGPDRPNEIMIQRLRQIASGELQATEQDLNFYAHELRESVRYRRMGYPEGLPPTGDAQRELWLQTHSATLEDYGLPLRSESLLYHPEALK